jgi:hypothetical protein
MRRKVFAVAGLVGVALSLSLPAAAGASTPTTLPALCVHQALPGGLPPLEVGYCPNG